MMSKLSFIFLVLSSCFLSSQSHVFYVGGDQGWIVHPSIDYKQWAHHTRFQVGDSLFFKYQKGSDSVLLVNEVDFQNCNINKPMQKWDSGETVFKFEHSGPFYFISGEADHCQQGQKLVVIVLHPRTPMVHTPAPAPAPMAHTPAPAHHIPSPAPTAHTPAPAHHHIPAPAPMADSPSQAPMAMGPPSESDAPAPAHMDDKKSFASSVTPSSVCILVSALIVSLATGSFMGAI